MSQTEETEEKLFGNIISPKTKFVMALYDLPSPDQWFSHYIFKLQLIDPTTQKLKNKNAEKLYNLINPLRKTDGLIEFLTGDMELNTTKPIVIQAYSEFMQEAIKEQYWDLWKLKIYKSSLEITELFDKRIIFENLRKKLFSDRPYPLTFGENKNPKLEELIVEIADKVLFKEDEMYNPKFKPSGLKSKERLPITTAFENIRINFINKAGDSFSKKSHISKSAFLLAPEMAFAPNVLTSTNEMIFDPKGDEVTFQYHFNSDAETMEERNVFEKIGKRIGDLDPRDNKTISCLRDPREGDTFQELFFAEFYPYFVLAYEYMTIYDDKLKGRIFKPRFENVVSNFKDYRKWFIFIRVNPTDDESSASLTEYFKDQTEVSNKGGLKINLFESLLAESKVLLNNLNLKVSSKIAATTGYNALVKEYYKIIVGTPYPSALWRDDDQNNIKKVVLEMNRKKLVLDWAVIIERGRPISPNDLNIVNENFLTRWLDYANWRYTIPIYLVFSKEEIIKNNLEEDIAIEKTRKDLESNLSEIRYLKP